MMCQFGERYTWPIMQTKNNNKNRFIERLKDFFD